MKVANIECLTVNNGRTSSLLVFVDTDDGITGVGEIAAKGWGPVVLAAVQRFADLIVGLDPMRTEHLWQVMWRALFFPAKGPAASALAGIDIALWDIKGKALGVPLYQLLGGAVRDRVACYAHAGRGIDADTSTDQLISQCQAFIAEGWRHLRWGLPTDSTTIEPRRSASRAVEQVAAVRDAVGDEIELILDVHTRLDPPEAVWLCRQLEPYRPFFVEDPLRSENLDTYRLLRQRTHVPLAAGEQLTCKWEYRPLIEQELVDYVRIDLGIAGGITEARKIIGWCETHHIKTALHNTMGPVGSAAALHVNLATSNFGIQEQAFPVSEASSDIYTDMPQLISGDLYPPTAAGLGVTVDRDAARARPAALHRPPQLQRLDGSFSNW